MTGVQTCALPIYTVEKMAKLQCLPDALVGRRYYCPTEEGEEKQIKKQLEKIIQWKQE